MLNKLLNSPATIANLLKILSKKEGGMVHVFQNDPRIIQETPHEDFTVYTLPFQHSRRKGLIYRFIPTRDIAGQYLAHFDIAFNRLELGTEKEYNEEIRPSLSTDWREDLALPKPQRCSIIGIYVSTLTGEKTKKAVENAAKLYNLGNHFHPNAKLIPRVRKDIPWDQEYYSHPDNPKKDEFEIGGFARDISPWEN